MVLRLRLLFHSKRGRSRRGDTDRRLLDFLLFPKREMAVCNLANVLDDERGGVRLQEQCYRPNLDQRSDNPMPQRLVRLAGTKNAGKTSFCLSAAPRAVEF